MKKIWAFAIGCYVLIKLMYFFSENSYILEDLQLNPNDYARITDVEYKAIVSDEPGEEGKVIITEKLTFDVHAASRNNTFWELWRDLPEDYVDGLKVHYKVNSVKQILKDGTEVIYEESPRLYWEDEDYVRSNTTLGPGKWYHSEGPYDESSRDYECVFFYIDDVYREEMVFEIEYEMYNAALKYKDCSDLYLALYSGSTITKLESFQAQILFPNDKMPAPGNYEVYTYGTNSHTFPYEESASMNPGYHTFYFELDEDALKFKPYNQYIEFDLVAYNEDKHAFTENALSNYYSSDNVLDEIREEQKAYANQPKQYLIRKIIFFIILGILSVIVLLYGFSLDKRIRGKHYFCKPSMQIQYFREIPSDLDPNFAATLVHCKHKPPKDDSGIYSALLLSLARKEYIELIDNYNDTTIIIKKTASPRRKPSYGASGQTSSYGTTPYQTTMSSYSTTASSMYSSTGAPIFTTTETPIYADRPSTFAESAGTPIYSDKPSTIAESTGAPIYSGTPSTSSETIGNVAAGTTATDATNPTAEISTPKESLYEPLTPCEEYYFNLIVRHAVQNQITMSSLQYRVSNDYESTSSFVRSMESSIGSIGTKEDYFQKLDYKQPVKEIRKMSTFLLIVGILFITVVNIISRLTRLDFVFGGFVLFGICCIIASVYTRIKSRKYVLLTQFGEDEYAKWRGLYNFLNSETIISERSYVEIALWEKYLIYASAFGIAEKVIKAIGIRCPEVESSPVMRTGYYNSGNIRVRSRSFSNSVRTGSTRSYSGGGGYGGGGGSFGYGGGGRGGGGGGGGH